MSNHTKNTPTMGNPLYTPAEQRAILAVMRDALALSATEIMIWVSVAPHLRGVFAYGYRDGWHDNKGEDRRRVGTPYDFSMDVYLSRAEPEALAHLAVMARDLREAVETAA